MNDGQPVKLEISKRLLQTTFIKQSSPQSIAKQSGWQESIARLLIRKPITNVKPDEEKRKSFGINLNDVLLEDNADLINQSDLISFCEQSVDLEDLQREGKDMILNEIQASVTEAANVIEREIKELAGSVSGAVAENIASGPSEYGGEVMPPRQRTSSNSSGSSSQSPGSSAKNKDSMDVASFDFSPDADVDTEVLRRSQKVRNSFQVFENFYFLI